MRFMSMVKAAERTASVPPKALSGGKMTVTDGPFTEAKEVVGGFAIFDAKSKAQMIEWTTRFMDLHKQHMAGWDGECEVRQLAEMGAEPCRPAE